MRRGAFRFLVWKPEGKRPLERPRHRWKNTIKINLKRNRIGVMETVPGLIVLTWNQCSQDLG
jgi:hypothetical protein